MLIDYYPSVLQKIEEIQEIAQAEDVEIEKLSAAIKQTGNNMSIYSADEKTIEQYEEMLKITPKAIQTLIERKTYIISAMNRRKMSLAELETMLSNFGDVELIRDMEKSEIIVRMNANVAGIDMIDEILDEVLPLNIYYNFIAILKSKGRIRTLATQKYGEKLRIRPMKG